MKPIQSEPCKRKRITYKGESIYLTIGDKRVMAHFAQESGAKNANTKEFLNLTCRLISKLRGAGVGWDVIYKQLNDSSLGYNTMPRAICAAIKEVNGEG